MITKQLYISKLCYQHKFSTIQSNIITKHYFNFILQFHMLKINMNVQFLFSQATL